MNEILKKKNFNTRKRGRKGESLIRYKTMIIKDVKTIHQRDAQQCAERADRQREAVCGKGFEISK